MKGWCKSWGKAGAKLGTLDEIQITNRNCKALENNHSILMISWHN